MFFRAALAVVVAAAASSQAALSITNPTADSWWVAKSNNVLSWTCQDAPATTYTVLINNTDPALFVGPMAIISIEQNSDCSKEITTDQANQPAGPGYTIILANPLNNTQVYAVSDLFEIKPLGSLYPSQASASSAAVAAASTSASGSQTSGSAPSASTSAKSNGATSFTAGPSVLLGILGAVFGVLAL